MLGTCADCENELCQEAGGPVGGAGHGGRWLATEEWHWAHCILIKLSCVSQFEYNQSLTEELSKGSQGLVIMKALYGTIAGEVDTALPLWNQRLGELIDVTIPVQAMVNGSHLVFSGWWQWMLFPSSIASSMLLIAIAARDFSELCGFYDPVNKPRTLPRYLIVRYLNKVCETLALSASRSCSLFLLLTGDVPSSCASRRAAVHFTPHGRRLRDEGTSAAGRLLQA